MQSSRGPVIATVMPKPCLKQATHSQHAQKHAHFPPPSEEARRYSGIEYDRTPIAIATNEFALPARGCPGRTFDDLDAHKYRHHHHPKKLRCPEQEFTGSLGPSTYSALKFGGLTLATDSGALPSLVHADTSESEEDEIRRVSDGEDLGHYPVPLLGSNGVLTTEPKRLRKVHHPRRTATTAAGQSSHRTSRLTGETTPTSIFASCPGSNSCLGGF